MNDWKKKSNRKCENNNQDENDNKNTNNGDNDDNSNNDKIEEKTGNFNQAIQARGNESFWAELVIN